MDVKNYRMNGVRGAETQYAGQPLYRDGAELSASAKVPSPANATVTPAQAKRNAYVRIIEQPAPKALRFRYECEGRSAGSIPGATSSPENKTFPTIQVVGYKGRALVVVSCVSKEKPYRPHPHNLVGKDGCRKGVCTLRIEESNDMTITFNNLGVQCVKKKDIKQSLKTREDINVDPFRTGFSHASESGSIDLNAVRLCFQVILEGECRGKFNVPLRPVVSDPIFDKKATNELVICELSQCTASVAGGQKIILLCEKVNKEDITIRFYEERDGQLYWEGYGEFQFNNVHKQTAISFRTPEYKHLDIDKPVKIFIQLRRPSDGASSESLPFQFIPMTTDANQPASKRARMTPEPGHLLKQLRKQNEENNLNIANGKENGQMNIRAEPKHQTHHHHLTQEALSHNRNEAPGPSTFYQGFRMPETLYRYPTPYDITPYHRYPAPAAPCTQSIYPGNLYQWPHTTARPGHDNKDAEVYSSHAQNYHYTSYYQAKEDETATATTTATATNQNEDYKYFANRYHQDLMRRDTTAHNNLQMNYNQPLPVKVDPPAQDVQQSSYVNDSSKDVPEISKLLQDQIIPNKKNVVTLKRQGNQRTMPNGDGGPNIGTLMNMDNQQLAQLNSTDLAGLSGFLMEPYCLPDEKIIDVKLAEEHEAMTDSFTRMSTSEIEDLTVANINDFNS